MEHHRPAKAARFDVAGRPAAGAPPNCDAAAAHDKKKARRRADRLAAEVAALPITAAKEDLLREVSETAVARCGGRTQPLFLSTFPLLHLSFHSSAPTRRSSSSARPGPASRRSCHRSCWTRVCWTEARVVEV